MINPSPVRRPAAAALLLLLLALAATPAAYGTQHLVGAGDEWESLAGKVRPGDEIILMTGRHRPADLENLRGVEGRPIVIRGLDENNPPVIEADRYGIRLFDPRYVRIENVWITGATINGILIDGHPESPSAATAAVTREAEQEKRAAAGHVVVSKVVIDDTGPRGLRHAMHLNALDTVQIVDCRVTGWAGSGLEIVACREVDVRGCRFAGKDGFEQVSGVRVRGGSDRVRIDRCRFSEPGQEAVCIGGASKPEEFAVPLPDDPAAQLPFEATRVQVTRCVTEGGLCAAAFVHCARSSVRQCTVVRPRQAVVSVRREHEDPRFRPSEQCVIGGNLFWWKPGDLVSLTHLGGGESTESVTLEDNLWWAPDIVTSRAALGPFPGVLQFPQVTDVDPRLDESLKPTVVSAEQFGAYAP